MDGVPASGSSPGTATGLTTPSGTLMYVGGIAVNSTDLFEYQNILDGDFHMGLKGCIANLMVRDVSFDMQRDALEGANIDTCDGYFSQ